MSISVITYSEGFNGRKDLREKLPDTSRGRNEDQIFINLNSIRKLIIIS